MNLPWLHDQLRLAAPWFLPTLILPFILLLLGGLRAPLPSINFPGLTFLTQGRSPRNRFSGLSHVLLSLCLLFAIIALCRPQKVRSYEVSEHSGVAIMVAFDVSRSMAIEDFTINSRRVNRLMAAKRVLEDFVEGRPYDRIGIVAFAGRPYLHSPLTNDQDWLKMSIERLTFHMTELGTAIGSAISTGAQRLDQIEAESKVLVLLTDGANNSGSISPIDAAKLAATLKIKVYSIAVGTPGIHPLPDPLTGQVQMHMRQEFDEETLKEIARIGHGQFFMADNTHALSQIFKTIDQLEKSQFKTSKVEEIKELHPPLIFAALGLFALWGVKRQVFSAIP